MSFLKWSDDLSVGVRIIDQQHQELINRIDRLLDAMKNGQGKVEADIMLTFLGQYVVTHFNTEERLMNDYHYPEKEYARHKQEHESFIKYFLEVKENIGQSKISGIYIVELQRKLTDWLAHHIKVIDVALGKFLAEVMEQ